MDDRPQHNPAPSESVALAKMQVRSRCREARDLLGEAARERASTQICTRIREWGNFPSSGVVFIYLPMRAEVDLQPLIDAAPEVHWAIPRVVEAPHRHLVFHAYDPDRLIQHRYGMLEPDPALTAIAPEEADLILVPGLAFSRAGYRLGYGGGYYDRLLAQPGHAPTLGACFQVLLLDEVPHEPHDVPVDFLVTEALGVIGTLTMR